MITEKLAKALLEHADDCGMFCLGGIDDEPKGDKEDCENFGHVYIDQWGDGDCGYHGNMYFPMDDGKYLRFAFECY